MRYILSILVFVGCSNDQETASPIFIDPIPVIDTINNEKLLYVDSLSKVVYNDYKKTREKITSLEKEREQLTVESINYSSSDFDESRIKDLRNKLNEKDKEIASLKNQLNDIYKPTERPRAKSVPIETDQVIAPDENSLVVNIDKGDLNATGVELYLIPFKGNKKYLGYDAYCDNSVNSFRKAESYDNLFFFNGVPRGKYIVKICYYYGGYKVVNKGTGKETISMQLSPPIQ